MRFFIIAFIFAISLAPAASHAESFDWPGHGKVSVSVPDGLNLRSPRADKVGFHLLVESQVGRAVSAQISLLVPVSSEPLNAEHLKARLENMTRQFVVRSVEKEFAPKPLTLSQGSGLMVELTDASQVGKPATPGDYKLLRSGLAFLDDRVRLIATIHFNDASSPDVEKVMSLLASLRFEQGATTGQAPATPFTFTLPESNVVVKVTEPSLRLEDTSDKEPDLAPLA